MYFKLFSEGVIMKNKIVLSAILTVAFIFVFGSLSWADSYRSEHHYYYYGDKHRPGYDRKHPKHYQKNHHRKPAPKSYSKAHDRHRPSRQDVHVYNNHVHVYQAPPQPVCNKRYPAYYDRRPPFPPVYAGSGYFFNTGIFEPGFAMALSIAGR